MDHYKSTDEHIQDLEAECAKAASELIKLRAEVRRAMRAGFRNQNAGSRINTMVRILEAALSREEAQDA
jgi:hypothetical protein